MIFYLDGFDLLIAFTQMIQQSLGQINKNMLAQGSYSPDSYNFSEIINQRHVEDFYWTENDNQEARNASITQQSAVVHKEIEKVQQKSSIQHKSKKSKVNNYPTKNCLALFKSAHYAYLQKEGILYQNFPQMVALKQKNGAAREDFLMLYQISQLREVWKQMLEQKFIYRYLMISRALGPQKKNYQSRIKALDKAFHKLEFERLNDK